MTSPADPIGQALSLCRQGRFPEARRILQQALAGQPGNAEAHHLLGVVELQSGSPARAVPAFRRSVELAPQVAFAWSNLGVACNASGDFSSALECFRKSLALEPGNAAVLKNQGISLRSLGRYDESMASLQDALARGPGDAQLHRELGDLLVEMGRVPEAIEQYDRSIALDGRDASAVHNRGIALYKAARYAEAIEAFRRALALAPKFARAWSSLGVALHDSGSNAEAAEAHAKAIELAPQVAQYHNNRGNALDGLGRPAQALACYDKAIALSPGYAEAWSNRGATLTDQRQYEAALASYERAQALDAGIAYDPGHRLHLKMHLCDWEGLEDILAAIRSGVEAGRRVAQPFTLLPAPISPALQRACSEIFARDLLRACPQGSWVARSFKHDRLRVGYFSADFRNHPVAYLVAPLVECHDRARFELTAFSFGAPSSDATRARLKRAFDHFEEVGSLTDAAIAERARALEIDIAVDLMGYTQEARTAIFTHRAAPIQVQYLGYPGTLGHACIDYLVADATVVPEGHLEHYREKIAFMPGSYQVNDTGRAISAREFSRTELGLPESGFVFCAFNKSVKITPDVFDAWMRILGRVEGSVLWLEESNAAAARNLRRDAERLGIAPGRLVFAQRIALEDHLARLRRADLFLDTVHYNGHATTSDTLLAGVPVLTTPGSAFPGRVAASLLQAVELPELIAPSLAEYESRAVRFATHPEELEVIRDKLAAHRATRPLFDTRRFARNLEAAFTKMQERQRAGLPPDHIRLE